MSLDRYAETMPWSEHPLAGLVASVLGELNALQPGEWARQEGIHTPCIHHTPSGLTLEFELNEGVVQVAWKGGNPYQPCINFALFVGKSARAFAERIVQETLPMYSKLQPSAEQAQRDEEWQRDVRLVVKMWANQMGLREAPVVTVTPDPLSITATFFHSPQDMVRVVVERDSKHSSANFRVPDYERLGQLLQLWEQLEHETAPEPE